MRDWTLRSTPSIDPTRPFMIRFYKTEKNKYGGHDVYKMPGGPHKVSGETVMWDAFDAPRAWQNALAK